jgi:transcription elongation factor Elf1
MKTKTTCNKCGKISCIECYIDCFKKNKGIIKCDICSFSFGIKTPDSYIDMLVEDIRKNAHMMNRARTKN